MNTSLSLLAAAALLALSACAGSDELFGHSNNGPSRGLRVADAALAGGLPQAALNATRNVLERDPTNIKALLQQGEALMALGRDDAATEAYRRILAQGGSADAEQLRSARQGMGRMALAAGRATEAEAVYRQIIAVTPGDGVGRSGLGVSLDLQGRHREAQAEYRAALLTSESDGARVNLGLSLAMVGDAAEAVAVLRPLARDPAAGTRVRHNLAFAMAVAGDRAGAERLLGSDMPRDQVATMLSGYEAFRSAQP